MLATPKPGTRFTFLRSGTWCGLSWKVSDLHGGRGAGRGPEPCGFQHLHSQGLLGRSRAQLLSLGKDMHTTPGVPNTQGQLRSRRVC